MHLLCLGGAKGGATVGLYQNGGCDESLSVWLFSIVSPLFFRFMFPTSITGLRPVDFPFKVFISGNLARFQFFFSENPFFHKIIENPIIKPHADRRIAGQLSGSW